MGWYGYGYGGKINEAMREIALTFCDDDDNGEW